ncbi:neural cell adhesion molecule 1-B-like [Ischnura elegans]|uniref:neural cell adhesion molecule 1-B-like n=1 Tax=Ischnura elegans TaxID=197161 RepID=UPI001ED88C52|nr:neural cell adhesion molecule 1-B-like [Ischnura elegans]
MVFWFRDDAGIPLYSFDVRGKALSQATHWSSPTAFGSRAYFRTVSDPASLVVDDVQRVDEGVYRCRVDYRNTPTRSFRYNLTVIVPPEHPVVFDRNGRALTTSAGPYNEGDDVILNCRVEGGKPEPTVRWLVDGETIDEQYERNTGEVIENRLNWPSVARSALGAIFSCQASNSGLAEPRETSLVLELYLKPLTVRITTKTTPLVADRRYEVTCESAGSRPPAVITWYKGKRQLRRVKEEVRENATVSELSFTPTTDDDGKHVTCRAENPNVTGAYLEDTWRIEVVYPPIVSLRLGSTLNPDDIKEGDDVYFECHVQANPPWRRLSWIHDGTILSHNMSARVIRSNQSLVLQKVTRASAGQYACAAVNPEGEGVSNELDFRVKFAPVCRHEKILVVGASRSEEVDIWCEVEADPPATSFRWKFNNSGETLDVAPGRFSSNGSASLLRYSPASDLDYGTLSCWAENAVGHQGAPCVYQVVAAGKPFPVRNCTLFNQTSTSVEVSCIPGFDGGLPQRFLLELYSQAEGLDEIIPGVVVPLHPAAPDPDDPDSDAGAASFSTAAASATEQHHDASRHPQPQPRQPKPEDGSGRPLMSITADRPSFTLSDLEPDVSFRVAVFAVNSKGRSQAVVLDEVTFRDPEKRTASDGDLALSPLLGVALGAALSLLSVSLIIAVKVRRAQREGRRRRQGPRPTTNGDQQPNALRDNSTAAVVGGKAAPATAEAKSLLLSATLRQAYGGGGLEAGVEALREAGGVVSGGGQFVRRQPEVAVGGGNTQLPPEAVARQRDHIHRRPLSASEETMGGCEAVPYPQGYATLSAGMGRAGCGEESEPDVIPANFDPYSQGRTASMLRNGSAVFREGPSAVSASVSPPPQPLLPARPLFGPPHPGYNTLPSGAGGLGSWLATSSPSNTPPSSSSSSACTMRPAPTPSLIADSTTSAAGAANTPTSERQQVDKSPSLSSPPPAIVQVPTSMPSLAWERPHDLNLRTRLNGGAIMPAAQKPLLPPSDVSTIQQTTTAAANPSSDFELNGVVIKERLMQARRLPESCV